MDFELTPEQEELRSSVRTVLEQECPISCARERVERGVVSEQPWRSARELHWPAIAIPENFGGLGLSMVELGLVLEELGRCLAPGPFLATVTQFAPLILEAADDEQKRRMLGALARGELTGALAGGMLHPAAPIAQPDREGWSVSGRCSHVIDADLADEIAFVARVEEGDGVALFVAPREALKLSTIKPLDATRSLSNIEFDALRLGPERALGRPGACGQALSRALEVATVALSLEMVGTLQAIFDLTLEYAKHREQFGRPIGSFQAIQHKFTDMFIALEKARSTAYYAAMAIAEDDKRRSLAASMAKAAAGSAQRLLAKEGIQIHGGLGFTWEHDIHLFVKRAKSGEALLGTSSEHRARIAELLEI